MGGCGGGCEGGGSLCGTGGATSGVDKMGAVGRDVGAEDDGRDVMIGAEITGPGALDRTKASDAINRAERIS